MPTTLTYPGVYVEEIPSGVHTIVGVATSITAFVGKAPSGPIDKATVVNSFADYDRIYGGLTTNFTMGFAVRDFFANGGTQAVIVRIWSRAVVPANASTALVAGGLTLRAVDPGSWGNNLRTFVDWKVSNEAAQALGLPDRSHIFNLTIFENIPNGLTERFPNLSVEDSPRRIDKVLAAEGTGSKLAQWDGAWPAAAPAIPADGTGDPVYTAEKALADLKKQFPPATPAAIKTASDAVNTEKAKLTGSDGNDLLATDFSPPSAKDNKVGLFALEQIDLFNLLCIPPYKKNPAGDPLPTDVDASVVDLAAGYCESRRAFLLIDSPSLWTDEASAETGMNKVLFTPTTYAGIFFPRIKQADPTDNNTIKTFVPSGAVAGIFARTDAQRGVWKAPAGIDAALNGVSDLRVNLSDPENGRLNPIGLNCLRTFPIIGRVVWGSRTLRGADIFGDDYKYIPVRRTALYIEESLFRGLQWAVFEPNDEPLWAQIRLSVGSFMQGLFRQGAFQGSTPKDAYFVKCDKDTTPQNDIDLGIVNIVVGFAP